MFGVVRRAMAALRARGKAASTAARPARNRSWHLTVAARRQLVRFARGARSLSPRKLVRVLGAIVAVTTALSIPAAYLVIGYLKEADALTYRAELSAKRAAEHIYTPDAPWRFATEQLAAIADIRTPAAAPIFQRVVDTRGQLVMQKEADIAWPTFARRAPIRALSTTWGTVEVSASLRPLLTEVAFIAFCSLLLSVAAYFAFVVLPLEVVDRSLGQLEQTNTLLKQREEALEARNLSFDLALENMFQGLAMFDAEERVVIANDRFAEMYGLTPDQVTPGTTLRRIAELRIANGLYAGFSADHVCDLMRERVARGTVSHITSKLADGRTLTVSIRPLPGGGWVTTHQDITEREDLNARLAAQNELLQQREAELRAQNAQIDTAINNMSRGLCLFDAEQRILVANRRYAELYDLSAEQLKPGTTLREILQLRAAKGHFSGQSAEAYITERLAVVAEGKTASITHELPDGRVIAVGHYPTPDGGWVTTHDDITERQRLNARLERQNQLLQQREDELEAQNLRFDAAMRHMSQGLCLFDADQHVVLANDRYAEIYGLTSEQMKPGTTLRQILEARAANGVYSHIDAQKFVEQGVAAFSEEVSQVVHLSDGRYISVLRRPMPDGGLVSTHEDVTEREVLKLRLEQQNLQLDAALNNMAQGLAMFDAEHRLVVCNRFYGELYGLTPDQVKPGTTIRQLLEHRHAKGVFGNVDFEAFVGSWLAEFGKASSRIQELADGRIMSIVRRRMPDGGLVSTTEDISEREKLKTRLAQQNEQLDAALNNMTQGLAMFDKEQRLIICNQLYGNMYGLTPEQVKPGTTVRQILEARLVKGCYRTDSPSPFVDRLVGKFARIDSEIQELADGRIVSVAYRETANGGHVITHEDVTERQKLNAQLEENNKLLSVRTSRLQTIIDNFPGGIAFLDGSLRVVVSNDNARRLLDLPDTLFAGGPPSVEDIFRCIARRGEYGAGDVEEQVALRMTMMRERRPHVVERPGPNGTVLEVRGVPLDDGGFVITYMNVTERRRSEAKIAHMALHDSLTGLANRVLLNERLEQALTRVKRGDMVAIHLLDLDHFKHVNDTLGHPAGDKLLKDAADRLRALVRETDTIARMGGDEFAILQVGIAQPAGATALAQRVIEVLSEPYLLDGRPVVVGTSVGIAVGPADGLAPEQLMRNADLALYRAKDDGRGTYRFFEPEMDAQMRERRAMEHDLRKALPEGEFELHYQPVVNLESNAISGFEALIRWHHPEKGIIAPGEFIPLAEEIGFIVPLGEWVVRQACATAAKWPAHTRVSVNLSPVQFKNSGLVQIVVGALAASGLAPDRLELEITESALLEDSDATLATLYQLRELGVRIAMDDFGTGYSSLAYLQSFPFDRIKIDRSFIRDIAEGVGSLNIVRAVAALAKGLGMETTAEGVETSEQRDTVRSEGCTEMQGFLFSRPRPVHEIAELLLQEAAEGDRNRGGASAA